MLLLLERKMEGSSALASAGAGSRVASASIVTATNMFAYGDDPCNTITCRSHNTLIVHGRSEWLI